MTKKPKTKTKPHKTTVAEEDAEDLLDEDDWVDDEGAEAMADEPEAMTDEPEVNPTGPAVPPGPSAKDRLSVFNDLLAMQHAHAGPIAPYMLQELQAIIGML